MRSLNSHVYDEVKKKIPYKDVALYFPNCNAEIDFRKKGTMKIGIIEVLF